MRGGSDDDDDDDDDYRMMMMMMIRMMMTRMRKSDRLHTWCRNNDGASQMVEETITARR